MGNSVAKAAVTNEAEELKQAIAEKCNSYVVGIENTSVVVDVELVELKADISNLVLRIHKHTLIAEVGMLQMSAIIEDVERHANCHKYAIWAMMKALNESQSKFEDIVSEKLNIQKRDEMISDTAVSNELRGEIDIIVPMYCKDLQEAGCGADLISLRRDELRRMLFKLGDNIIIQVKENIVNDYKNTAFEQIDEILCSEMSDGTFSDPYSARSLLQSLVTIYAITSESLSALPFLQRTQVESAQDKLSEYIEDLIRRVQMVYAYHFDESAMRLVLDLQADSSDEGTDSIVSSVDDDTSSIEEVEQTVSPVVVKKKATAPKSGKKVVTTTPKKNTPTASKSKALTKAHTPVSSKKPTSSVKGVKSTSKASKVTVPSSAISVGKRKRKPSAKLAEQMDESPKKRAHLITPVPPRRSKK